MSSRFEEIRDWEALAREAKFRPAAMAGLCSISLRQLERFFAMHFHTTPRLWLRELKCRLARDLIAQGWSSKAVAEELWFVDNSNLCHTFKQFYGVAPQAFGPRYKKNAEAQVTPPGPPSKSS